MKTSKLEAKPSENSNKRKKKLPLQNFHQQILIKFFDIERMYTFLVLRAIAIKEWRKRKHAIEPDPTIGQGDRRVDFLKREGG